MDRRIERANNDAGECIREEDVSYDGVRLDKGKTVKDEAECKDTCATKEMCMYWTLVEENNWCRFYTNITLRNKHKGYISGNKACGSGGNYYKHSIDLGFRRIRIYFQNKLYQTSFLFI